MPISAGSSLYGMRVLVNALPLRQGGGVTYFQQQMSALAEVAPDLQLHTLISPWSKLADLPGRTETVKLRTVPGRFAYEQTRLPLRRADVLYCPANFGPLAHHSPMILTLHNANYYAAASRLSETRDSRPWWKVKANHLAMARADVVVAISTSLASDVLEAVPSIEPKMTVLCNGASEWPPHSTPVEDLPERYLLTLTSAAPHKRLVDVVAGWARSRDGARRPHALVTVGENTPEQLAASHTAAGRHAASLVHLGQIRDRRRLKWVYEHATALVSMSLLEAFPLTPGEAGAVGCPLVLTDIPAHREVTMGNGVFVPPYDVSFLADVLASQTYEMEPGTRPWCWPSTWQDNGRELAAIMRAVA